MRTSAHLRRPAWLCITISPFTPSSSITAIRVVFGNSNSHKAIATTTTSTQTRNKRMRRSFYRKVHTYTSRSVTVHAVPIQCWCARRLWWCGWPEPSCHRYTLMHVCLEWIKKKRAIDNECLMANDGIRVADARALLHTRTSSKSSINRVHTIHIFYWILISKNGQSQQTKIIIF